MTTKSYKVIQPTSKAEFAAYHQVRFEQLRQPWGQPEGSEVDDLEHMSVHRMVVDEDQNVVAVGRFHKVNVSTAQVRFMAVAGSVQGKGIGRLLLSALELEAAKQGVQTIELNAREVALQFYQSNGYELLEKAHLLYGEIQHYSMKKSLPTINNALTPHISELEQVWHKTIPISKHMLIHPASLVDNRFTVCADRAANINLHNTMFAGSIYTLATLCGWGMVHLLLKSQNVIGGIVLADADIRYSKPLHGQPLAVCDGNELSNVDVSVLAQGKRLRINLSVNVCDGDTVVAKFNGKYVVLPTPH